MNRDERLGASPEEAEPAVLADLDLGELRSRRARCVEAETGLSYVRRLAQGSLDIARGEQERRRTGAGGDLAGLLGDLPGILGDARRSPGGGRLSHHLEPADLEPDLQSELDGLLGSAGVSGVVALDDTELAALVERLGTLERRISQRRRELHGRIDALQAELVRRYRSGEASVESLLD